MQGAVSRQEFHLVGPMNDTQTDFNSPPETLCRNKSSSESSEDISSPNILDGFVLLAASGCSDPEVCVKLCAILFYNI